MVRIKTRYLVVRYELYDKSAVLAANIARRDIAHAIHERLLSVACSFPIAAVIQATKVLVTDAKAMLFLVRTERRFLRIIQNCLKRLKMIKRHNLRSINVIHVAGSMEQCKYALRRLDQAGHSKEPSSLWKARVDIL